MEKVVFNIKKHLVYFSIVLLFYKHHSIDLLRKSVDWFLYNGNTDLNSKVDVWLTVKMNMLIFRCMFLFSEATPFFISISVA